MSDVHDLGDFLLFFFPTLSVTGHVAPGALSRALTENNNCDDKRLVLHSELATAKYQDAMLHGIDLLFSWSH